MSEQEIKKEGLLSAIKDAIEGNYATDEEKERRLSICLAPCEFVGTALDDTFLEFNYCTVCNCPLKTKTALKDHHCPKEFW